MQPDEGTLPSLATIQAAVSLLGDPMPTVARACSQRILDWGKSAIPFLLEAAEHPDARLRVRARALLRTIDLRAWVDDVRRFADRLHAARSAAITDFALLEEGVCLLSAVGRPLQRSRDELVARLDAGGRAVARLVAGRSAATAARLLGEYLAGEQGFDGERGSYYEPRDVSIDTVLARRSGTPIALCLVYLLIGRRAGLRLTGVNMPDHALLRLHGARPVLIDPFHGGRTVTRADCVRYLRGLGYSYPASYFLGDLDDRQVLLDFVGNLARVYGYKEDRGLCQAIEQARGLLGGGS